MPTGKPRTDPADAPTRASGAGPTDAPTRASGAGPTDAPTRASGAGPTDAPRRDLAALIVPLGRTLMNAEQPILQRHGIAMWAYAVLLALDSGTEPVRTQAALAQVIGADKTRIIAVLDDLQERGLIRREADPDDRRVRLLAITPSGRKLCRAVQTEIQEQEERTLARLEPPDRAAFLRILQTLAGLDPQEWRR